MSRGLGDVYKRQVLIVILAVFAVFWAVKQITVNTRVASEISYKE